jgi:hypothetical protein
LGTHGYSAGYPGCASILKRAKYRRPHSEACKRRFQELLKDSDKLKAADEWKTEALAKMLEKADEEGRTKRAKTEVNAESKQEGVRDNKGEPRTIGQE